MAAARIKMTDQHSIQHLSERDRSLLYALEKRDISSLDLLPHRDKREKLVDLVLHGHPAGINKEVSALFGELRERLVSTTVDDIKVVVFGGGTGLSNIIGGDSRQQNWPEKPFEGLKEIFPQTKAIVCVTDDGGSTGELLKDLPVFGLGDIRHVLVSSIQRRLLERRYNLSAGQSALLVKDISTIFNFRFSARPESAKSLLKQCIGDLDTLPEKMARALVTYLDFCLTDELCLHTLGRPHCLGNLLILSAIRMVSGSENLIENRIVVDESLGEAINGAISNIGEIIGAGVDAVLPCTPVPAQLRFRYSNGVEVSGENKSSTADRGSAIARVTVDFCGQPYVSGKILDSIRDADVLIMAPGSLYSSIIPVMQVPGIAATVRENRSALKLLIANLWVQEGETDKAIANPDRKFHVSDMIRAYEHNLPGGVEGLIDQILCLSMQDVPASVIQNYAVEGKNPIYLDREILKNRGFTPIECGFFSRSAMIERGVIQHDPEVVAQTVKTLFLSRELFNDKQEQSPHSAVVTQPSGLSSRPRLVAIPSVKYALVADRLAELSIDFNQCEATGLNSEEIVSILTDIIWTHQDIPVSHLDFIQGITFVSEGRWRRDQRWDNVFSFYDPEDGLIKIREDRIRSRNSLEVSFLIALGQALLGDYAASKLITPLL
ncbi:MAG: gluconeogenesis factor YvcK family protein, partial [Desulfocapsaceae bacterium]